MMKLHFRASYPAEGVGVNLLPKTSYIHAQNVVLVLGFVTKLLNKAI